MYRNGAMPMSMTESFPPADGPQRTEEGVPDEIKAALFNPYAKHGRADVGEPGDPVLSATASALHSIVVEEPVLYDV